jgi:2-keto-3-deoxy-6-phosphogluconate aldolase
MSDDTGRSSARGRMPLIAVLRGVQPTEVGAIGAAVDAGFAVAEVPLRSPQIRPVRVLPIASATAA